MEQKEIDALKAQYGKIVEIEAEGHKAYFRKPTRTEMSYALSLQANNKSLEMIEHILTSCFVAGDEIFKTDLDYMLGASDLVNSLIQIKHCEIKNL